VVIQLSTLPTFSYPCR